MSEQDKHHDRHGHGVEGHWGERPEHPHECGGGGHGEHHRHGGECCGGRGEHHRHGGECCGGEGKAWGPGSPFRRHFITREERIAWLEEYLKELQAEAKGVEERIVEMKASG